MHNEDMVTIDDTTPSKFQSCFKGLRKVNRLLIRHARNLRRIRQGKAMFRVFVKKPSVALECVLSIAEVVTNTTSLPPDLSVIRDETTGRLITAPDDVVATIALMETAALSPDLTLPHGLPSHS